MKAVAVFPGSREIRVIDAPEPSLNAPDDVKIRILEVGVCATDRDICAFQFGEPPPGSDHLILGHEGLGEVIEAGNGATHLKAGDLVVPIVRQPCGVPSCDPCRLDRADFCLTDAFPERGIRRAHGFMAEQFVDREASLVAVPRALRDSAVLVEPLTIAEKGLAQAEAIQQRLPYPPGRRAVVLGAGPVGLLGAMALRIRGYETSVIARNPDDSPNARLAQAIGATYLSSPDRLKSLGSIDLVYEAAGAGATSFELLAGLGTNGIFILTGVPPTHAPIPVNVEPLMWGMVLKNQVLLGTVNAGRDAFEAAIRDLGVFRQKWPDALRQMVTGRFRIEEARRLLLDPPAGIKSVVSIG